MRFLILLAILAHVRAIYFTIEEGKQPGRCFIEEVPEETNVVGNYKSPDHALVTAAGQGGRSSSIVYRVKDPTGALVLEGTAQEEGRFKFTSRVGGEHTICLSTTSASWFGNRREFKFHLHLDVGEEAEDYEAIARLEHLSAIEVEIRRLNDKIRTVRQEQTYQKMREEAFRDTSESTNSRVMWWSIIQTVILVLSGFFQMYHLKHFFRAKKLV
uniref:Emp24/gp25L/p24 family protein n=1 Tax=Hirondellea gigas TaxID=1518452 RepID=A0A6A7G819_9CRUS